MSKIERMVGDLTDLLDELSEDPEVRIEVLARAIALETDEAGLDTADVAETVLDILSDE